MTINKLREKLQTHDPTWSDDREFYLRDFYTELPLAVWKDLYLEDGQVFVQCSEAEVYE